MFERGINYRLWARSRIMLVFVLPQAEHHDDDGTHDQESKAGQGHRRKDHEKFRNSKGWHDALPVRV